MEYCLEQTVLIRWSQAATVSTAFPVGLREVYMFGFDPVPVSPTSPIPTSFRDPNMIYLWRIVEVGHTN